MELPEATSQPKIRPTQLILHSIVAPWTPRRTYEYWRDSTNLESHFGVGYDGAIGQYIPVNRRADANYQANRRPDGDGAVSVETASDTSASDPWTDDQLKALTDIMVWMHRAHGVPVRACRSHDDPGFGFHRMHSAWSPGTHCPGDKRVRQFWDELLPEVQNAVEGEALNEEDLIDVVFDTPVVWVNYADGKETFRHALSGTAKRAYSIEQTVRSIHRQVATQKATIETLTDLVSRLASQAEELDPDTLAAELRRAIEEEVSAWEVDLTVTPSE